MQRPGLYFPFIHVRDDEWLKTAALYWPSVRRLVPRGYSKHDSPTAQTFFDAAILRDETPDILIGSTAWVTLAARVLNWFSACHPGGCCPVSCSLLH